MSQQQPHEFDPRLLDYHLGQLAAADAAALLKEIAEDPILARDHATLGSVFAALNSVREAVAPADLSSRISARVRAAESARHTALARPRLGRAGRHLVEAAERRPDFVLRFANLRDIVAIAAMIVLAIGIGVPSLLHMRERNQRIGCSWNLAQVGRGIQTYSTTYSASIPFAGWSSTSSWIPVSTPGVESVPNRRHLYPLLRDRLVSDPKLFVCPSRMDVPMAPQQISENRDFPESRNISYAYFNMAGVRPSANGRPEVVVLADDNPIFEDGRPLFDWSRLKLGATASQNSRAHRGAGQNILTIDGKVKWSQTPDCGFEGDNIWMLSDTEKYTGREGPVTPTDSHLLK